MARIWWKIVVVIIAIVLGVPALRGQAFDQARRFRARPGLTPFNDLSKEPPKSQEDLARRAFRRYPNDPEMLLGAGALALAASQSQYNPKWPEARRLRDIARPMLERATRLSDRPAAWAAYSYLLIADCNYERLGTTDVDPGDREAAKAESDRLVEESARQRLEDKDARPALDALRNWRRTDPGNAAPIALEAYILYGLHRDAEALSRWIEAGRCRRAASHSWEIGQAASAVLRRLGMSDYEALFLAHGPTFGLSAFRAGAHVAVYEGRRAQMQGRAEEAITLWQATIQLARLLQSSASDGLEFSSATAIKGIGASPAWVWRRDRDTGVPGGPLQQGRYWYGPQHAFFVSRVGVQSDAALRDELIAGKAHMTALRDSVADMTDAIMDAAFGMILDSVAILNALAFLPLLFLYLFVSAFGVASADAARLPRRETRRLGGRKILIIMSPAILFEAVGMLSNWPVPSGSNSVWFIASALAVAFATSVLVAIVAKQPSSSAWDAWRGYVREAARGLVLLSTLIYLAAAIGLVHLHRRIEPFLTQPEMRRVVERAGPSWSHPTIPKDAWRPQPPPRPR